MDARTVRTAARGWVALLLVAISPLAALAQQPATLTLEEATAIARRNNPDYLMRANDASAADWAVREAYGALLPGASASSSLAWQDAGTPRFGFFTADDIGFGSSTSYYSSSYSLGLSYRLSGSNILAPSRERANRRATEAGIVAGLQALEADVTLRYLALKRARDAILLAEQELVRAEDNLRLVAARAQVGLVAELEVAQAEVERGRAEVALLQSRATAEAEQLALIETLGIELDRDVELTSSFDVIDLPWEREQLLQMTLESNGELQAAQETERVSDIGVRMARTAYLPSVSMQAGFSGYTREAGNVDFLIDQARAQADGARRDCQFQNDLSARLVQPLPGRPVDCAAIAVTPQQEAQIRETNSVFPFDFTREPLSVSLTVSLPVFQGFSRERQIEEAKVAAQDSRLRRRATELRLNRSVATAHSEVVTARQSVQLEERNRALADDQLRLARERYRLGSGTWLELREAETVKARADRDYLSAQYRFHEGLARLEAAVGRPLRTTLEGR